jgi:thioredoxin reductase
LERQPWESLNTDYQPDWTSNMKQNLLEVIIVGGGPAGLNAALVLARCRRKVMLFDDGKPRNAASHAVHGFLSRDGIAPDELRAIARDQLEKYPSVVVDPDRVIDVSRDESGSLATTKDGRQFRSRKLLLAGGVVDELPTQPGFQELYGIGVFHCPYCDGWEVRDRPIAVYGKGDHKGAGLALEMTIWTDHIVLCTDGPSELSDACRLRLEKNGITTREERILRLDMLDNVPYQASFNIIFEHGPALLRSAMFFNTSRHQSTNLAERLGCDLYDPKGCTIDNHKQITHVPGLYVAGDASRDVLQAIVAAAEGAQAAIGINTALLHEDLS